MTVETDAHLTDCIVAEGARIGEGLSFARCAIVPAGARGPTGDELIAHGLLIHPF